MTLEIVPEMLPAFQLPADSAPELDAAISHLAAWVGVKLGLG